eukprot:3948849-Pyramimonas_sp.AAC.1
MRMQGALDAHLEAFRAGRGQRKRPRMDPGSKEARVPLGGMPILTLRATYDRPRGSIGREPASSTSCRKVLGESALHEW